MLKMTDLLGNTEYVTDFKKFKRKRKANGDKTIDFTVFQSDKNKHSFNLVQEESTFEFQDETYVIKKIKEKSVGTKTTKQVNAVHKFFEDMNNHYIYDSLTLTQSFSNVLAFIFAGTGYNFVINGDFPNQDVGENFGDGYGLKLFKQALQLFGSEFRIEGETVYLEVEIGSRTDIQFRYGYNVTTIDREVDTKNLTTYVRGYGDGIESEYTSPNAAIYGIIPAQPVRDDRITNIETLERRMKERINDTPDLKIKVNVAFIDADVEEGDYLFVIYEPMNDLDIEVRVMEIEEEFDFNLKPIRTNVTLASLNKDITDTIVQFNDTQKRVNEVITERGTVRTSVLEGPIDALRNMLRASASFQDAQVVDGGILFENTNENSPDFGALYIGPGLFSISNQKDNNGNWIWRSFGTGNGFTADLMTAGTMLADRVRGGQFRVGGFGNGDGIFELYDEHDSLILRFNNSGIELFNGAQLIGNGGVLSNFVIQMPTYESLHYGHVGDIPTVNMSFSVPEDFTIVSAILTIYALPTRYETTSSPNPGVYWTNVRQLEATLAEGVKGFYDFVEGSDAGVGFVWQGQSYSMSQIFGMNTWTPPRPSSSNPRAESISADISNIIESGTIYNLLMTTRDTNRPPEDNTGFVRAVLEVVGYQH